MKIARIVIAAVTLSVIGGSVLAGEVPRSAYLMKESGNAFLAAKKYADAIDSYLQALEISPTYPEAHYNLAVAFLRGCKAYGLSKHHFERYLELSPRAKDREDVAALISALAERITPLDPAEHRVVAIVAGRLLVSGADWVKPGDRLAVADKGKQPCASLMAGYVYPDCVLTQRVWDDRTLEAVKAGQLASNLSQ